MKRIRISIGIVFLLIAIFILAGCTAKTEDVVSGELSGEIVIYHAGSLTIPLSEIEENFEKLHPNVDVIRTPGGSRDVTRRISEFEDKVDILFSADYSIIDSLLIPDYASWNILFAENSMVVMYTEDSKYANEITADNWYEILIRDGVDYGYSEPNADPCGYRTLLIWQLAEKYYGYDGLNQEFINNCPDKNVRPKSVELIAMLETGALDYAFEYESVAMQHVKLNPDLKYIVFPDEVNLSSIEFKEFYSEATVELSGTEPGTVVVKKGAPIVYGFTMPTTGENPELAMEFIKFLLSRADGMKILLESGQPILDELVIFGSENLPEELKYLLE